MFEEASTCLFGIPLRRPLLVNRIELISSRPGKRTPGLTAVVSVHAISRLRAVAKGRGCSITALANSALENWLKGKNA